MSKRNDSVRESLSVEDWQFYAWVRETIGVSAITGAHGCSQPQAYRYCRDPRLAATNDASRTPISHLRDLLDEVSTVKGGPERIRIMLDHLAASIGCHVACPSDAEPDKQTIEQECLDDYPPLSSMHEMIRGREHVSIVRQQKERADKETAETFEAYARSCGPDGFPRGGNAIG